jgi:hypothetical protein
MGITQLITQFYKGLPKETFRKEPTIGQLCWAPILHINKIPRVMDVERADPKEHYATKFRVRNLTIIGDGFQFLLQEKTLQNRLAHRPNCL